MRTRKGEPAPEAADQIGVLARFPCWQQPGQPFDRYVRDHVLDPLRMNETRYFVPEGDRARQAAMYQRSDDGVLTRAPDDSALAFNTSHWSLTPGGFGLATDARY